MKAGPRGQLAEQADGEIAGLQGAWQRGEFRPGAGTLTAGQVTAPSWSGGRRAVGRDMIQRAVLVSAELGSARSHVVPLVLLIGAGGRCLLHVSGTGIAPRDLKAFAAALQVPVGTRAQRLGPDELRSEYPGSVSWYWSNQVLAALLASLLLILIVIGVVVALAVTGALGQ